MSDHTNFAQYALERSTETFDKYDVCTIEVVQEGRTAIAKDGHKAIQLSTDVSNVVDLEDMR